VTSQIAAQLAVLDDAPDKLHLDRTPAVVRLVELGPQALAPTIDHLDHPEVLHRMRAQRVVEGLTRRQFGFDGTAWPDGAFDRWQAWWTTIGYDARGEPGERAAAIARLRASPPP